MKHEYRRMLSLSLMLPLLQQASGINTVIYYSSMVFLRAGLKSPILGSIFVGVINLGFTAVAAALMDRRGRLPLLQLSFGGMAASLGAVALAVAVPSEFSFWGAPVSGWGGRGRVAGGWAAGLVTKVTNLSNQPAHHPPHQAPPSSRAS